jgi:hypothetical protein
MLTHTYKNIHKNNNVRYNDASLNTIHQREANKTTLIKLVSITALMILSIYVLSKLTVRAINIGINNQDIMLCKSAEISGNTDYLEKCECYYEGKDIECIERGDNK